MSLEVDEVAGVNSSWLVSDGVDATDEVDAMDSVDATDGVGGDCASEISTYGELDSTSPCRQWISVDLSGQNTS